ncbi:MAG: NACHT domain-containing protein [Spirochaetota bacterium]
MNLIDLEIQSVEFKISKANLGSNERTFLKQVVDLAPVSVILGPPGSGKSSVLRKFHADQPNAQYLTVRKFLESPTALDLSKTVLLLDGLDEYRSSQASEQAYTVERLGEKINQIGTEKPVRVIIACREMDWFGETDVKSLTDEIKQPCRVYSVCPLTYAQQLQLAQVLSVPEPQAFVAKYSDTGFLNNPQMFMMMVAIQINNEATGITKKKLYLEFIKAGREKNQVRALNDPDKLAPYELLSLCGYLAFMFFFAETLELNAEIIDDLQLEGHFTRAQLKRAANTTLFTQGQFIHRTISEFACAWFIDDFLIQKQGQSLRMVKSLFVHHDRVPTELRGIFAWLCSITQNHEFISVDPYYQLIHADCSGFSVQNKEQIIKAVESYAKANPYFYNFRAEGDLSAFYVSEMDEFMARELEVALKLPNHYAYFLAHILFSANTLSPSMKSVITGFCMNPDVRGPHKAYLVKAISSDHTSLIAILETTKQSPGLDRDDSLKDAILKILYPNVIDPEHIVDYLFAYQSRVGGHCYYLFSTPPEKKLRLVEAIMVLAKPEKAYMEPNIPENCEAFIYDFFAELVLKYPQEYDEKEVYQILKRFRPLFGSFMGIPFRSYRSEIRDALEAKKAQLTVLANAIFSLYVDDALNDPSFASSYHDYPAYVGFAAPNEVKNILLRKLTTNLEKEKAIFLIIQIFHSSSEANKIDQITELAQQHGVLAEIQSFLNPQKTTFQIQYEQREQEQAREQQRIIAKNDANLETISDEDLGTHFGYMSYIADFLFFEPPRNYRTVLSDAAFERLKKMLKTYIMRPALNPDLITIQSLIKDAPAAMRQVDLVYYVSCALNTTEAYTAIKPDSFLTYLYIVCRSFGNSVNVIKAQFPEWLEQEKTDLAKTSLRDFFQGIADEYCPTYSGSFKSIIAKDEHLQNLKTLANLRLNRDSDIPNTVIAGMLQQYGFEMDSSLLESIFDDPHVDNNNKNWCAGLKNFKENGLDKFTISQATGLYKLLIAQSGTANLNGIDKIQRTKLLHYFMTVFRTEEDIKSYDGFQSDTMQCASFLHHEIWGALELDELHELRELHNEETDIWRLRILHHIGEKEQKSADQHLEKVSLKKAKSFLLQQKLLNVRSYFDDIVEKFTILKTEIENNTDNEKDAFYDSDGQPRDEEFCRDILRQLLNGRYGYANEFRREKYMADNRVDINIMYKSEPDWQVQVECKRDSHGQLYNAIKDQLIAKYLNINIPFGIYLVFVFDPKKNTNDLLERLRRTIPSGYEARVEVILMDLRK